MRLKFTVSDIARRFAERKFALPRIRVNASPLRRKRRHLAGRCVIGVPLTCSEVIIYEAGTDWGKRVVLIGANSTLVPRLLLRSRILLARLLHVTSNIRLTNRREIPSAPGGQ